MESSQDEWSAKITRATIQLRGLLFDVDSASAPVWSGPQLTTAIYRYTEIFLPMLAAHSLYRFENDQAQSTRPRLLETVRGVTQDATSILQARIKEESNGSLGNPSSDDSDAADAAATATTVAAGKQVLAFLENNTVYSQAPAPMPPLDVAFCWALHRLNPTAYKADCERLFGTVLLAGSDDGETTGLSYVTVENQHSARSTIARMQWDAFAQAVRNRGEPSVSTENKSMIQEFLPKYLWPRFWVAEEARFFLFNHSLTPAEDWNCPLSIDLSASAARQKKFLFNISTPYYDSHKSIENAVLRYKKFLRLIRENPYSGIGPSHDIDLVWHAHILYSTKQYIMDCQQLLGRFLNHNEDDETVDTNMKRDRYRRSSRLWEETYAESMVNNDTRSRGSPPENKHRVLDWRASVFLVPDDETVIAFVLSKICSYCARAEGSNAISETQFSATHRCKLVRVPQNFLDHK